MANNGPHVTWGLSKHVIFEHLGRGKTGLIRREAPGISDARQEGGMDSNTELPLRFEVRVRKRCQTAIPKTHTECHELGHMRSSALGADFLV